jgi:hypothetical protein
MIANCNLQSAMMKHLRTETSYGTIVVLRRGYSFVACKSNVPLMIWLCVFEWFPLNESIFFKVQFFGNLISVQFNNFSEQDFAFILVLDVVKDAGTIITPLVEVIRVASVHLNTATNQSREVCKIEVKSEFLTGRM